MSERSEQTTGAAEPLAGGGRMDSATEAFLAHRNLLFTVAYEMLGSAADAEDVLQETWLRWAGVDLDMVRDQRAYLGRIAAAASLQQAQVNGYPALIIRLNGEIDTVLAVRIDDSLITGLYAVRNPEKLSHMEQETTLRR
jgi:hypothetical protein